MGLKHDTREIDGTKFRTSQLPALASLALLTKVVKLIAPILGELEGIDIKNLSFEDDIEKLVPLVTALFSELEPKTATELAREILTCTTAEIEKSLVLCDNDGNINQVFSGRLITMFKVIMFSLEVNFGDFTAGGAAKKDDSAEAEAEAKE